MLFRYTPLFKSKQRKKCLGEFQSQRENNLHEIDPHPTFFILPSWEVTSGSVSICYEKTKQKEN